jgi:DNA ligase 1
MISRPMLAASYTDGCDITFPLLVTSKVDGIRALIVNGSLVSRSFKPIPNVMIRRALESILPEGADGEITCGDSLYSTTSVVMSENVCCTNFTFSWFDWAYDVNAPYVDRVNAIVKYMHTHDTTANTNVYNCFIVPLIPQEVKNVYELEQFNKNALNMGYEGVVARIPSGKYKCGRSTIKEGLMIKIKGYADCEAEIVGTEELMRNINEEKKDNFGNVKRSSSLSGMVKGNTLGAIIAMTSEYELFKIGTGFTANERDAIWANRDNIVGHFVKYKCAETGSKNLPRNPVFLAIRHKDDTSY